MQVESGQTSTHKFHVLIHDILLIPIRPYKVSNCFDKVEKQCLPALHVIDAFAIVFNEVHPTMQI